MLSKIKVDTRIHTLPLVGKSILKKKKIVKVKRKFEQRLYVFDRMASSQPYNIGKTYYFKTKFQESFFETTTKPKSYLSNQKYKGKTMGWISRFEKKSEMLRWIFDTLTYPVLQHYGASPGIVTLTFFCETDMVLFKLRWL